MLFRSSLLGATASGDLEASQPRGVAAAMARGLAFVVERAALVVSLALILAAAWIGGAQSADDPVFRIEFADGVVTPSRIEVPADTRIELLLVNKGTTPAEFESLPLRKEKVLAPGTSSSMVIKGLDPGEYPFFDDFHPDAPPAVQIGRAHV